MSVRKRSAAVAVLCGTSDSLRGSSTIKNKGRQFTKAMFDKWQEHEREHRTLTWLHCELGRSMSGNTVH